MVWREGYPAEGDLSGLETAKGSLRTATERADQLVVALGQTMQGVSDVWKSDASVAWVSGVGEISARCESLYLVSDAAREVVRTYVDGVEELAAEHGSVLREIGRVESRARAAGVEVEADLVWMTVRRGSLSASSSWGVGPGLVPSSSVSGAGSSAVCEAPGAGLFAAQGFEDELWGLIGEVRGLAQRRRDLDRGLRDGVAGVLPVGWAARREVFVASGVSDPRAWTPMVLARALADQAVLGQVDDQVVLEFLTQYGQDEAVMSAFFLALGGEGTLELVARWGTLAQGETAQNLAWVEAVRAGFATGSAGCTEWQAGRFADGLFNGIEPAVWDGSESGGDFAPHSGLHTLALAALFAGPPFAGVHVAVAVADRLDEVDRRGPLASWRSEGGLWELINEERRSRGQDLMLEASPADAILRTLGQYPRAASNWLSASPPGDRVQYWFGEHPWESRGGFEGVLTMLAATQESGVRGLTEVDGVVVYDLEAMERAARLASQGLTALTENPAWAEDGLNDREGARLADVINENWDAIHAIWTSEGRKSADGSVIFKAPKFAPKEDDLPFANIDTKIVTGLFGAAAFSEAGEAKLRQGYGEFVAAKALAASRSSSSPPQQVRDLQDMMRTMLSKIEGSQDWARVDSATRAAANMSSTAETTLLVAGIAASAIVTGGGTLAAVAVGAAVSLGSLGIQTGVDAMGQGRVAEVEMSIEDLTDDRYRAELIDDVRVAAALLGVELPPHPSTYVNPFSTTAPANQVGLTPMTEEMWLKRCVGMVNYEFAIQDGRDPAENGFNVQDKAHDNRMDREAKPPQ